MVLNNVTMRDMVGTVAMVEVAGGEVVGSGAIQGGRWQ